MIPSGSEGTIFALISTLAIVCLSSPLDIDGKIQVMIKGLA